ncbi:MAG: hypothetical protein K0Q68_277 [Moraxellaceae bacterium]|jgi:uncharacterized protein (TIRG00374 family)|nr:hypothetical protein [Moraxellaceae bacterium]
MANAASTPAMPRLSALLTPGRVALLVAVVILSAMVPLLVGGRATLRQLEELSWQHIALLLLVLAASWGLNALRCQLLLRSNGVRLRSPETLAMIWLYESAAQSTPGGLGGPVAGWAMLRRRKMPTRVIASLGLFMLFLDIAAIISLVIATLLVAPHLPGTGAPWYLTTALWGLLFGLALLWGVIRYRRQLLRMLGRLRSSRGSGKWRPSGHVRRFLRLGHTVERVARMPRRHLLILLLASTAHWGCRMAIFHIAVVAVGGHVSWTNTLSIQLVSGLAGIMTGLPGGYLGADMTMTALLMPVMGLQTTATVILLWRLLTFHATLVMGVLSLPWLARHLRSPGELHATWRHSSTSSSALPGGGQETRKDAD